MVMGNLDNQPLQQRLQAMLVSINEIVLDKPEVVKLAVACLLANGHLLLQDLPGMGKTTLAHAIANHLGLSFNRVQFTSDMLPADILGISLYKTDTGTFEFKPGPIFCQLLLADEINRSSPKTQSALLEAMEERQVTVDGETRPLPEPFFVIATQNPSTQIGTYPLPESQLDRFLLRIELGYPNRAAERALLEGGGRRDQWPTLSACFAPTQLILLQQQAAAVHAAPALFNYLQNLIEKTRNSPEFVHGLSPRAALALLAAARAWAFIHSRAMVLPEDVQAVFPSVAAHRLRLTQGSGHAQHDDMIRLLHSVPVL